MEALPLTALCKDRLETFKKAALFSIPISVLHDIFSPICGEHIHTYSKFVSIIEQYGRVGYNHLYVSLIASTPWIDNEITFGTKINFFKEACLLEYTEDTLFTFAWIRAKDKTVALYSNSFFIHIITCLNEGYSKSHLFSMDPYSENFCYLIIINYGVDVTVSDRLSLMQTVCSDKLVELPCVGGAYRFTDLVSGISIVKTPFMFDFTYNEYIVLRTQKYVYSECDCPDLIIQDIVSEGV